MRSGLMGDRGYLAGQRFRKTPTVPLSRLGSTRSALPSPVKSAIKRAGHQREQRCEKRRKTGAARFMSHASHHL